MKEIDVLLEKYAKGELSAEEQVELNRLTRRDEVLAAAGAKAQQLKRRQRACVAAVASLLAVASVVAAVALRPSSAVSSAEPIMAQTDAKKSVQRLETDPEAVVQDVPQTTSRVQAKASAETVDSHAVAAPVEKVVLEPDLTMEEVPTHLESDAVVACNTQCSPDSVINEIWKFLKA